MNAAPILSVERAKALEIQLFNKEEAKEWKAMAEAGQALGHAVLKDFCELGEFPATARVLVLVGKGHNGGDALIAAQSIIERYPCAAVSVLFVFGQRSLRPLATKAYQALFHCSPLRVDVVDQLPVEPIDLCLDGVFGFQFRPPLDARVAGLLSEVNARPIRFRAAVDLPSGLGSNDAFRADFTYATGIVKDPLIAEENREKVGRLRYLDLGFFRGPDADREAPDQVLTERVLDAFRVLRPSVSDKRKFGQLFVFGGSRSYPGAVLMSVLAAMGTGTGLITAFVPESLVPAYAARVPEAMWVGWPETPAGGLALEGLHLFRARISRASAMLLGPGLAREPETLALVSEVIKSSDVPVVLDADALQPETLSAGDCPRIVTPHAGEFQRISGGKGLRTFAAEARITTVLKSSLTQISEGKVVFHSPFGGPILARGGSGDLLAGMVGGLLAQENRDPLLAAQRGVVWHGLAADRCARSIGQVAVHTTKILDYLPNVLRER